MQLGLFTGRAPKPAEVPLTYPAGPGHQSTATSIEAALSVAPTAGTLRNAAHSILHDSPSTADEVAATMNQSVLAIRPRITELKRFGQIRDSGDRRKNRSGKSAIVWKSVALPEQT